MNDETEDDEMDLVPETPDGQLPEEMRIKLEKSALKVRPHTPEELGKIYDWANRVLVAVTLLSVVEDGKFNVRVHDGKVKFAPSGPADPTAINRN